MASRAQGAPAFRRWVTAKLAVTRQTWPAGTDEELAEWFGVTVAVLREARELQQGDRSFGGYERVDVDYQMVRTMMPEPVFAALLELERVRDVPRQTLLRSVVHHVLSLYELPDHPNYRPGHGWQYGDKLYKLDRKSAESGRKKHRWDVSCYISTGAREALSLRATLNQTVVTALLRGGLLDLLSGRITQLEVIPSVRYMPSVSRPYTVQWKETDNEDP